MLRRSFVALFGAVPFLGLFRRRQTVVRGDDDVVMQAIGEASMCWDHPDRAGVFDSERAAEIGNRLKRHFADGATDFASARARVCQELQEDEGLWRGYRDNIAMVIYDNSCLNIDGCNKHAERIMKRIFGA